ncbi:MAG: hypothetical protein Q9187_004469 [Circinaria calcarea]
MTDPKRDVTPERKDEGWLQDIGKSTRTRQAANHLVAVNNMATARREATQVAADRMARAARRAERRAAAIAAVPNPTVPTPAVPSPTEMPYGYQRFAGFTAPSNLIGTAGPSQNSQVFQQQRAFQQHQPAYSLPPSPNPLSQGASSPQTTQLQDTAPLAPSPYPYAPRDAVQNPYRPLTPWPLGYAPRDTDPSVEVSPTVVSGPTTTERLQQEVHEPAIRLSQVPASQYTRVGKVQKNSGYARRTSTGEYRLTCERCRSKHYACNTGKPDCAACTRAGVPCVYTKKRSGAPLPSRRRVATTASAPAPAPVLGPPPSPFAVLGPPPDLLAVPGLVPAPAPLVPLPPVPPFHLQAPEQEEAPADWMEEDDLESRIDPALRSL